MKDFYKILGVKENASEEEIRERWVELTKHYHPDRGEDKVSEEKIREINEAYQVLKHSSTRVEYDLSRTYGPKNREKKRKSYFKRLIVPASILIIIIIFSVLYFQNFQNQINQIDQTNQINQTNQIDQKDQIDQKNQTDQKDAKTQQGVDMPAQQPQVAEVTPAAPIVFSQRKQTDQKDKIGSSTQRPKGIINPIAPSIAMAATIDKVQSPQPSQDPITPLPNNSITNKLTSPINKTDQINQIDQRNQKYQVNLNTELAQFKPPSALTTEDEVKKFFKDYIERYDRMDIEGFLSLFSPKAIQNQKDRLEGIRKIYIDFFNQGEKVRYRMQDMKIEIYQNVVEVKARYEIVQTMKSGGWERVWRGNIRWVLGKENGALKILSLDYQHQ
jgi:curved DNA-binding protein CbpA